MTSSKYLAKWKVIPYLISASNSSTSLRFSSGNIRVVIPSLLAPIVFSFTPPMADTFPDNVIYPVMAISRVDGLLRARETNEQVMATPADGPSLPISISGKFK
jgi:hypothetical protein